LGGGGGGFFFLGGRFHNRCYLLTPVGGKEKRGGVPPLLLAARTGDKRKGRGSALKSSHATPRRGKRGLQERKEGHQCNIAPLRDRGEGKKRWEGLPNFAAPEETFKKKKRGAFNPQEIVQMGSGRAACLPLFLLGPEKGEKGRAPIKSPIEGRVRRRFPEGEEPFPLRHPGGEVWGKGKKKGTAFNTRFPRGEGEEGGRGTGPRSSERDRNHISRIGSGEKREGGSGFNFQTKEDVPADSPRKKEGGREETPTRRHREEQKKKKKPPSSIERKESPCLFRPLSRKGRFRQTAGHFCFRKGRKKEVDRRMVEEKKLVGFCPTARGKRREKCPPIP